MKATDLIAALKARAAEMTEWDFTVDDFTDEDGDGKVVLNVTYSEDLLIDGREVEYEPWEALGPFGEEPATAGIDNDEAGHINQWVQWTVKDHIAR